MEDIVVFVKPDHIDEKTVPSLETSGAAGYDLRAKKSGVIQINETKLVETTFKWEIPKGYVGMICSRSGLALKNSVFCLNAPGIIDSDYRGTIGIILRNMGNTVFQYREFDRIAQMVILELPKLRILPTELLSDTERGDGGFGSTGNN